jgi:hypothetical protein
LVFSFLADGRKRCLACDETTVRFVSKKTSQTHKKLILIAPGYRFFFFLPNERRGARKPGDDVAHESLANESLAMFKETNRNYRMIKP